MEPALDAHHWLARFAVRLMALRPELSFRAAVARAAAAHAHAKTLTPEDAAQIDADVRRSSSVPHHGISGIEGIDGDAHAPGTAPDPGLRQK